MGVKATYLTDRPFHDWEAGDTPAEEFLRVLSSLGVDLAPPSAANPSTDHPVIVLVTKTEDSTGLANRSWGYKEVIPVSFLNGASSAFRDLSQVIVADLGITEAAERVARIVRFGGRTMVEWNRLVNEASMWAAKPSSALLLPSERLPAALEIVQSDYALASPKHRDDVTRFLEAGLAAVAKRRRRGRSVVAISALVLTLFVVLAITQASAAVRAEQLSVAEANTATANRLSGIAREYLNLDPDLPSILIDRATELSDNPAVAQAAADVAASTIEHRSIALPSVPRQVSAARESSIVAVSSMQDSSILMVDGTTEEITAELNYGNGGPYRPATIELSPDGAWLAVQEADSAPRLLATSKDSEEQPTQVDLTVGDDFLGWWRANQGIISRSNQLLVVDFATGRIDEMWSFSEDEAVRALALSAEGDFIAVALTERVVLLRTDVFEEVRSFQISGVTDLAVSADGSALFGVRFPYGMAITVGKTEATDKITETTLAAISVEAHVAGFFTVGDRRGGLSLHAGERSEPAFGLQAHLTDPVRLARLTNGKLASIGLDRYLRLWDLPDSEQLGTPSDLGYQPAQPSDTAGGTHQIRYLGDNSYGVVIAPSYIRTLLIGDGSLTALQAVFGGLHVRSFLSPDARHIAMISMERLAVFEFDRTTRKWNLEPVMSVSANIANMRLDGLDVSEVAISPDGESVLIANAKEALVWRGGESSPSSSTIFSVASTPVAARVGNDHRAQAEVVTADGVIHQLDGSEGEGKFGNALSSITITSAVFIDDETLLYVDDAGALSEYRDGTTRQLLPPGSAHSSFRLRASSDGRHVAVLTSNQLLLVNRIDGRLVLKNASLGPLTVVDVAFSPADPGTMRTISSLGTIGTTRFDPSPEAGISHFKFDRSAPREITPIERESLSLTEVDPRA